MQKGDDENRGVDTSPMQPIFSFFQKEKKIEKKTVMQPGLSTCNHLFHVTLVIYESDNHLTKSLLSGWFVTEWFYRTQKNEEKIFFWFAFSFYSIINYMSEIWHAPLQSNSSWLWSPRKDENGHHKWIMDFYFFLTRMKWLFFSTTINPTERFFPSLPFLSYSPLHQHHLVISQFLNHNKEKPFMHSLSKNSNSSLQDILTTSEVNKQV